MLTIITMDNGFGSKQNRGRDPSWNPSVGADGSLDTVESKTCSIEADLEPLPLSEDHMDLTDISSTLFASLDVPTPHFAAAAAAMEQVQSPTYNSYHSSSGSSDFSTDDSSFEDLDDEVRIFLQDEFFEGPSNQGIVPSAKDVLFGRGGGVNGHEGNKAYLALVESKQALYSSLEGRRVKTDLTRSIIEHIHSEGGRFLVRDSSNEQWMVAPATKILKKVSQAMRTTRKRSQESQDDEASVPRRRRKSE